MPSFTPGNIVVYRVGNGAAALSGSSAAGFLDEYTPTGTLVQSIALPTADAGANQTLTDSGSATSHGLINRSADGRYLLVTGYDTPPGTANVVTTATTTVSRIVGRVGADGIIDTTTALNDAFSSNYRSAASADGTSFYLSGNGTAANAGTRLATLGATTSTQIAATPANQRAVDIFNGQLYMSTGSGTTGIYSIGIGTPVATGQTATLIVASPNPYQFIFLDRDAGVAGLDTLYVSDQTNGLAKFSFDGTVWTSRGAIAQAGLTGLDGFLAGGSATLFATNPTTLFTFNDTAAFNAPIAGALMTIGTATANTVFRGVALAPQAAAAANETISVTTATVTQNEGDTGTTPFTYILTRTGSTAASATVAYAVTAANGTTTLDGTDFGGTLPSGTATFAAGSATATVTINVSGDRTIEATEGFTLTLSGPSMGYVVSTTAGSGSGTITNDDVAGTVTITDATVNEGAGTVTLTLTRNGGGGDISVTYATTDGTAQATAPADYVGKTGTVDFIGGSNAGTITITIVNDAVAEATETFAVTLAAGTGNPALTGSPATVTITDDDPPGSVSVANVSVNEAAGTATITLTRTGGTGTASVNYATADGSATGGTDYTASTGTATFAGNATATTFTIPILEDANAEGNETFLVNLTTGAGNPTLSNTSATVTILDNDFTVDVADVTVNENAGTATITLTRNSGSGDVSIGYATANGTALAPGDYTATTGTAIFTGTATTTSFTVAITDDAVSEATEALAVNLSVASGNATLTRSAATVTITDNDGTVIPGGAQTTAFNANAAGNYTLLAGTTRTQTTTGAVTVTSSTGPVNVDIEGTLTDTTTAQRAINFGNQPIASSLLVGANGSVQSVNGDTVRFQSVNGTANLTNLGQILMTSAAFTPNGSGATPGSNNPGSAFAITYNAAIGAVGAPASDYTSGGTIINGSATNSLALIRSDNGDAVRLGSHETLVNYGAISGAGQINDSSDNNAFAGNGQTSVATPYDISRGVRVNQAAATAVKVDNFGIITGAQHGLDVGVVDATNLVFINEAGASIIGRNGSGIGADTTGAAANTVTISNSGLIEGRYAPQYDRAGYVTVDGDGDGIDVDGAVTITNFAGGTIGSTGAGGFDKNGRANNSEGVTIGGGILVNAGTIRGAAFAVVVNNDSNANGSRTGVAATTITNQAGGTITGQAGFAIRLENKAGTAIDNDSITNYGTITGNGTVPDPAGIVLLQNSQADTFTVGTLDGTTYTAANAGSARFIRGDGAAIQTGEGSDTLVNYGAITGNSGRAINLEGGADALTLYTGGTVAGRIDGGAGTDTLTLRIDDRPASGGGTNGNNSGATAGTLANVVNFEALNVASGFWTIGDAQGYASGTTIASGASLFLTTGAALTGAVADNGSLVANGTGSVTLAGTISGTGRVQQAGTGTLVLTGTGNSYSGGTTLASTGTLDVAALGAAGTGAITFFAGAQTLRIEAAALNGGVFGNAIAGFTNDGDVVDVRGIGTATASYNGTTGVLTLMGTGTASLTVGTGYTGFVFNTAADGAGGTNVTVALPPPTLSIAAASVTEGNSGFANLIFTVTASGAAPAGGISFTATSANGTATTADGDYTAIAGSYMIAAGQTTTTVFVAVTGDTRIEADETLSVTLSNPTNATLGMASTATGTILNDDFPALSISDPSVVEGNAGGTAFLRYTVTASAPAPTGGLSFTIATADGTAVAGSDYLARTVTGATIAAGQTSYTFDVQVTGDVTPERAETVLVNLSNPVRATIADAQGVGTIDNDDGAPAGLQPVFSANFNGFTAAGFAPMPTAAQLDSNVWRVTGLSDNINPAFGGTYTTGDFARGVIAGTADPVSAGVYSPSANAALIVQPTSAEFENGGFIEAQIINTTGFTATSFDIAFDWAYRNSGDRADALTFSYSTDGTTFVTVPAAAFTTPATKDVATAATFALQNETLTIGNVLVGADNALLLRWTHTGSTGGGNRDEVGIDNVVVRAGVSDIQTLSAADISVTEGTGGQSFATFTVTRSTGTGTASVAYATADGTAIAGSDYTAQSGTLTFAEGERSKTVAVAVRTDSANEANETFVLNLSNATGVTVTDAQARATIVNDDTGPIAIYDIQGAGHTSPFVGQAVTTGGVVTAILGNSFYVQDSMGDGRFATSDGIQVFFSSTDAAHPRPTTIAVGDLVSVTGTVTEFLPTTGALTVTELTAPTITYIGPGALPGAVVIGTGGVLPPTNVIDDDRFAVYDPQNDAIDFYEALEGMVVTVQAPIVVAPTTANSNGDRTTYIVASGGAGATNVNERGGITLTGDDAAPERIQIFGSPTLVPASTLGDRLADVTGVFTYFTYYEVLPTGPVTTTLDRTTTQEQTLLRPDADHLQIVSFNIENADPTDPQAKFDAIGVEIVTALGRPDIIGLQEVQDADGAGAGTDYSGMATAQKVIDAILAAGGPAYTYLEIAPTANNTTGGEPNGNIRNGYLYNAARVSYVNGSAALIQDPAYNNTRKPLVAQFTFNGTVVTVIDQHSTSRGGSDLYFGSNQPPAQAGDAARTAQAVAAKAYIDNLQAADPNVHVIAVGDFNGYYYEPALSTFTADGKLTNLYTLLPVAERYSYLFEGAVQAFDNIIVSNNLLPQAQFDIVHYNAEQTVQPITDHDQAVASLYIPRPNTAPTDLAIDTATVAENAPAGTLVGTVTTTDAEGGAFTYALTDSAGGRFAIDATTGRLTTTQPFDFEATTGANVTVRVTDAGGLTYSEALPIAVTNVNEVPTALTLSNASVAENAAAGTLAGTLAGTDPDAGTTLRYSLTDNGGGRFTVDAVTGAVTTTQPLDYETLRSVAITGRVSDGSLTLDRAFTVAVVNVNEAPTGLALTGATVAENAPAGTLVGTAAATDPEGDALRYSLVANAGAFFAIDAVTGRLTTTQPLNYEAATSQPVTIRATDTAGLFVDRATTIAVSDVNEAPAGVTISSATVVENAAGGTVIGTLNGNDPDAGDSVTFALAGNDARFRVNGNQLVVAAGADIDYESSASIALAVTATDRAGLATTSTISIAVQDVAETFTGTAGNDTINGDAGANTINGGAGDDVIFGRGGNDIIDGGDGNDTINGGAGADRITLGLGADSVRALLSELLGDTITDFGAGDRIVVQSSDIHRPDFQITGTGAATVVQFAAGTIALTAGRANGDLMVAHSGTDSIITYQGYLATLDEGKAVDAAAVNGIANQPYLTGDTSTAFTVRVEALSRAAYDNTLGVYEIDTATGAISDVRIVAGNVKTASTISVTGVDVGHQLGFFLVQDGAHTLSAAVLSSTSLSLISQGGHLVLANNGTAVAGATTFFSHDASANIDGFAHVLSGVAADGSGDLRIGFEDLVRSGSSSDNDFQDVVLTVEAVPQVHAIGDLGLMPLSAADVAVLHG